MIKEAIGTGSTVDEARENALLELGARDEDDVSIEVLDTGRKKSFGLFGGAPARVRAYIEIPEPPQKAKPVKQESKAAVKNDSPKNGRKKEQPKPEKEKQPATAEAKQEDEKKPGVPYTELDHDSHEFKAASYLANVLEKLGCTDVSLTVSPIDGGSQIMISGEGLGIIIGHRGETLDAMQHLTSLAANAGESGYYRVVLNTGDYRERREQTLINLAKRMAAQAIRAGKCRTLEPMNPYERRIIHTAVQAIDGVSSTSFGEGAGRRVVIAPDGVTPKPRNDFSGRSGRGGRRQQSGRSDRGRRDNKYVPTGEPHEKIKDAAETPLYGKIEL